MGLERLTVLQRHRGYRGQRSKEEVRASMKDRNMFKLDGRSREEGMCVRIMRGKTDMVV